jgi:hypothetical protein
MTFFARMAVVCPEAVVIEVSPVKEADDKASVKVGQKHASD